MVRHELPQVVEGLDLMVEVVGQQALAGGQQTRLQGLGGIKVERHGQ